MRLGLRDALWDLQSFLGHATVLQVLRWLTIPFVALFVIMSILTAKKVDLTADAEKDIESLHE